MQYVLHDVSFNLGVPVPSCSTASLSSTSSHLGDFYVRTFDKAWGPNEVKVQMTVRFQSKELLSRRELCSWNSHYSNFPDVELLARRFGEVANAGAENWYRDTFLPKMRITRKDPLVLSKGSIAADGIAKGRGIHNDTIYDLTDFVWSLGLTQNSTTFAFLL
ncbi:hypothetical protein BYT27DRAFT_7261837 [Phlegmacium glaucopus]|nr:hypothetical protein BYT27DRAFT_7261837 [Phlegmacium glaucopus]